MSTETRPISQATIEEAARRLHEAAPGATIILFGSYASGSPGPHSDLDFLVVEPVVRSRRLEMVRLSDVLRPLRVPADVLVASREHFEQWRDTPCTVMCEAARKGRAMHGAI